MRIALVESVPFPPTEGLGNYVWNLAKRLAASKHEVQIFTRGRDRAGRSFTEDGIRVHETFRPEIPPFHVHLHRKHLQRALDEHARDVDVVHVHAPLPPPVETRAPQLLTFHTPIQASVANLGSWDKRAIMERLQSPVAQSVERALIRNAAMVSAVSRSVAEDLSAYGLDPATIRVVGNGIDPDVFRPGTKPREDFLLVTGRLSPRKGLPDLLDALAILRSRGVTPKLVITGKGPLRPRLEAQARRLGIADQVDFRGFVAREALIELLQTCAVYTFPSHYEGLPTSILEAMACGAPIVAAAAHGTVDVLFPDETATLVPVGSPGLLADAASDLLRDAHKRARFARDARAAVEERFAWGKIAQGIGALYAELASIGERPTP